MLVKRNDFFPTFPKIFSDFFDKEFSDWAASNYSLTNTTIPAVNIRETDDDFIVTMAVPGMDKKDFKISLVDNLLTISSERKEEKEDKDANYTKREYSYQSFNRAFTLPKDVVKEDKITAKYENGELHLTIPKKEEVKAKRPLQIKIK